MIYYLAGKMTGIEEFNYPMFNATAARLRAQGYTVLNPAEIDGGSSHKPRDFYLRIAIGLLLQADAVAVMDGWRDSRGACLELMVALELGMPVFRAEDMTMIEDLTHGDIPCL